MNHNGRNLMPANFSSVTLKSVGTSRAERTEKNDVAYELKSWPELFEPVRLGRKTHDLRRADDRNFQIGDRLRLREFDPKTERYSGRECTVEVTYITSAHVPCAYFEAALHPQYCILSIRLV